MLKYFDRINKIDFYIAAAKTGSPRELAKKIGISERSIFEYIGVMKAMGAPIRYNRPRRTYRYEVAGEFKIGFAPFL